ncbi:DDE-type integrase/transposase/recombinase [Nonomuraea sp. B19D2]|uniref:DDE-type integrase/transposase/recombinase n=1 Tax=Nonomuraea sp. B19D2 TaxID=3159561 RepID=UPI0032DAF39C
MSKADEEARRRAERAQKVGLWRYQLIREAADPELTTRQRGRLVRALAGSTREGPFGEPILVSRGTIDRWIRDWREGGFEALVPHPRNVTPRTPEQVLNLAAALKREKPERTAAQIVRILRSASGWSPSARTLIRHFDRLELNTRPDGQAPRAFGRFEATHPNDLWTGDALHGPKIAGRKTFLFAFIDDHSRLIVGHRWGYFEDTVRLAAALRPALAARGVPQMIYFDNGSAMVDAAVKRAAARLGIKIAHSAPGRPEGRGKIERWFGEVRRQFLVEIAGDGETSGTKVTSLTELNRLFTAWVETAYHRRVHSETGQTPLRPGPGRTGSCSGRRALELVHHGRVVVTFSSPGPGRANAGGVRYWDRQGRGGLRGRPVEGLGRVGSDCGIAAGAAGLGVVLAGHGASSPGCSSSTPWPLPWSGACWRGSVRAA